MIGNRRAGMILSVALIALAGATIANAKGKGGSDAFSWNLAREFGILRGPEKLIGANENIKQSAMRLQLDRHYLVSLLPQNSVGFVVLQGAKHAIPIRTAASPISTPTIRVATGSPSTPATGST